MVMAAEISATRALTSQIVDDLLGGLNILLNGLPNSGRSYLVQLVISELKQLQANVVLVNGNKMYAERPLLALSLISRPNEAVEVGHGASTSFDQTATAFKALLDKPNSVLIVDDADKLDRLSVGLIMDARAAKKVPILLVGGHGIQQDDLLTALVSSAQPGAVVTLDGLSFEDTTQLINTLLNGVVDPDAISQIARLSGGLPGLIQAIVALGRRSGRLVRQDDIWVAVGDLWDDGLRFALLPFLDGLNADDIKSLTQLANAESLSQPGVASTTEAEAANRLATKGLLRFDPMLSMVGPQVFPGALAEFLSRGSRAKPVADDDLVMTIDVGKWPVHLTGIDAAAVANRIRINWRNEVGQAWGRWNGDRAYESAVPLLRMLLAGGGNDERVGLVLDRTKPGGDCDGGSAFAVLKASHRAVWQHDLPGALADLDKQIEACPKMETELRAQQARLVFLCGGILDAGKLEAYAAKADSSELLLAVQAEAMLAQGRVKDAEKQLSLLRPRNEEIVIIKQTLDALVLVLGDDPGAGVEMAIKRLWESIAALDMRSITGYAYVAALGMCMLGRFDELKSIVEIIYRIGDTNLFQSRYKTGLFMFGSFVSDWEGRRDYARNLESQATMMSAGVGPFPGMFGSRELRFDDSDAGSHLWSEVDDLLDHDFLAAAVYLAVLAVETDPSDIRSKRVIAAGRQSQSRVLRALTRYVATTVERDLSAFPETVEELRQASGPLDVTRATVTWALLLREAGDNDGWLQQSSQAWRESTSISGSANGLLDRLVRAVGLTSREAEVARYIASNWSSAEIASQIGLGVRTIEAHLYTVYRKCGVNNREELRQIVRTWLVLSADD